MSLDPQAMTAQRKLLVKQVKEGSAKRERMRKEKGTLYASTLWHPCEHFPFLELTKGEKGLKECDILTLSRFRWGWRLEPAEEEWLLKIMGGRLSLLRRQPSFIHDEAHRIGGYMDRLFRFDGKETLVGELTGVGAIGQTLYEKEQRGEGDQFFDFFADPGPAHPWLQAKAGQVAIYTWMEHQKNPHVNRAILYVTWKDNGYGWVIWFDLREYPDLIDKILTRADRIHRAAAGGVQEIYRTSNWSICEKCPRLLQCAPERIAEMEHEITDAAIISLAQAKLRYKEAETAHRQANNQLKKILNERFANLRPAHVDDKFKEAFRLGNSGLAVQVQWIYKKSYEVGEHWELRHKILSGEEVVE